MTLNHLYPHVPLILGHRGAAAHAPENTLTAFRQALACGADGFELDVTLTADGVPVVIHDDRVDRTTNGSGRVAALTLAEIKRLDAGAWFGARFAGEPVPTLQEVLEAFGARAMVNVELKADASPERQLARKVVEVIRSQRAEGRVLLSSFDYANLRRVKDLDRSLPVGLLYSPDEPWRVAQAWLRPGVAPEAHHPYHRLANGWTMRLYRRSGQRVNIWTVNAKADLVRALRLGVDAIITDYPELAVGLRDQFRRERA